MARFSVKVRRGPLSGYAADGRRLNILPGVYAVEHEGQKLSFEGADQRNGGILIVDLTEYPEIGNFPDIEPGQQLALMPD